MKRDERIIQGMSEEGIIVSRLDIGFDIEIRDIFGHEISNKDAVTKYYGRCLKGIYEHDGVIACILTTLKIRYWLLKQGVWVDSVTPKAKVVLEKWELVKEEDE